MGKQQTRLLKLAIRFPCWHKLPKCQPAALAAIRSLQGQGFLEVNDKREFRLVLSEGSGVLAEHTAEQNGTANTTELADAAKQCLELLEMSSVRFHICDGGRGNLGEHSLYHRSIGNLKKALKQQKQADAA